MPPVPGLQGNEGNTAKMITKGRNDLAEKCTRFDFAWREASSLCGCLALCIGLYVHRVWAIRSA